MLANLLKQDLDPCVCDALRKQINGVLLAKLSAPKQDAQQLREAAFPRAEETADPNPYVLRLPLMHAGVGLKDLRQLSLDACRRVILLDLLEDRLVIQGIDLDDLFDLAVDLLGEQLGNDLGRRHRSVPQKILWR